MNKITKSASCSLTVNTASKDGGNVPSYGIAIEQRPQLLTALCTSHLAPGVLLLVQITTRFELAMVNHWTDGLLVSSRLVLQGKLPLCPQFDKHHRSIQQRILDALSLQATQLWHA
jgi:hypothetical protein